MSKARTNRYARIVEVKSYVEPLIERLADGTLRWRERPNFEAIGRKMGCTGTTVANIVTGLFGEVKVPKSAKDLVKRAREAAHADAVERRLDDASERLTVLTGSVTALGKKLDEISSYLMQSRVDKFVPIVRRVLSNQMEDRKERLTVAVTNGHVEPQQNEGQDGVRSVVA